MEYKIVERMHDPKCSVCKKEILYGYLTWRHGASGFEKMYWCDLCFAEYSRIMNGKNQNHFTRLVPAPDLS